MNELQSIIDCLDGIEERAAKKALSPSGSDLLEMTGLVKQLAQVLVQEVKALNSLDTRVGGCEAAVQEHGFDIQRLAARIEELPFGDME